MRTEAEIKENLEWLKHQCVHYADKEQERIIRQLEVLLWVLGHEREEAESEATAIWRRARSKRRDAPRDYPSP